MLNILKKKEKLPKIKRVIPTDDWKLIFEFDEDIFKIMDYQSLGKEFSFLAYPNQLKAFNFSESEIIWKNGIKLELKTIHKNTKIAEFDLLKNKVLRIDYKNQAPTTEHKSHHCYGVYLRPFNNENQIELSESIAGGIAEQGGSFSFSIAELKKYRNWKKHFELSGCNWSIEIIENEKYSNQQIIDNLIFGIRERSEFNK